MNINRDLSPLSSATNLIVIDSNIDSSEDIISGFSADTEILILNTEQDAIAQITEALAYYEEVSSLQIFSHGDRGLLQLGNTNLSLDNITEYQDELASWQNVLTADGDILLYGCNVAEGEGTEFVDTLSQLTGADVAASMDLTGSSFLGGDGELEYATGEIEASALSAEAIAAWDFILHDGEDNHTHQDLSVTDGLVLHLDADAEVTVDETGIVTGWSDKLDPNKILTGFGDPKMLDNRLNGNSVIKLDNQGDRLELTSGLEDLPAGNSDRTVFFVTKYDGNSNGTGGFSYGSPNANQTFGLVTINGDLALQGWQPANDFRTVEEGRGKGWLIQSAVVSSDLISHYKNGELIDTRTHTYNTELQKLIVGAEIDGAPSTGIEVAEILVYDRAVSDLERQEIENSLSQEYGLDSYLTLGNPNFQIQEVVGGLRGLIDIETLPDGRMLILRKSGEIKIVDPQSSDPVADDYLSIPNVSSDFEWGLYSVALDPNFESNNYFYVYYSNNLDGNRFRISRFVHDENHADLEDELVVWEANEEIVDTFHYGGGLDFGPDGMLYLATGDVFDDPQVSQDLTHSGGKLIRIDVSSVDNLGGWVRGGENTHIIPDDNPFVDGIGSNLDEIWAYGLRNPFRADWDEVTGNFYIGEVGGNDQNGFDASYEDLHIATVNDAGANFGWPLCEGPNCFVTEPDDYLPPLFSIQHTDSRAIVAGTVYRGNQFPDLYNEAFFFADFAQGWLRALTFDANGNVANDVPDGGFKLGGDNQDLQLGSPAALTVGADEALYYVDINRGALKRITFDSGNLAPIIDSTVATASSENRRIINFASSVTDNEGDNLTYTWNFGDGTQASGANVSHEYSANGVYPVSLSVTDSINEPVSTTIDVLVGQPPKANIAIPNNNSLFRAGDTIDFSGSGSDLDGTINDLNWTIRFIHDNHFHPELSNISDPNISFEIPSEGHDFSGDTGFEITLEVTDSDGLSDREIISIFPEKSDLSFTSNVPGGVNFIFDDLPRVGDFTHDTLIDFGHTITAPDVVYKEGIEYTFQEWLVSDSTNVETQTLSLTVPEADTNYTANYIVTDTNVSVNANSDRFTVTEDAVNIALDVLANDTNSSSGGAITITEVGVVSDGGAVTINDTEDGLIYTPAADFAGIETFTYDIVDENGSVSEAEVAVAIAGTNDAPNAVADSFNVDPDSTDNSLAVLANDLDADLTDSSPVTMEFNTYEVDRVSTVSPNRAIEVRHSIPTGELKDTDFIFDATSALGSDPHFHMMGMPEAMRPNYLTQHNSGGNGQQINFTMAREDNQAFAFEGFNYTSGLFFPGANAGFRVIGTLANGDEISQSFAEAEVEQAFQTATLEGAGWQNVVSVRFEGDLIGTGTEVSQELNIDNLVVDTASDVLEITSVSTPDNGGNVAINSGGLVYTPAAGFEGRDTFEYTIEDLAGETSTATVRVNVGAANLPVSDGLVLHLEADNGVFTDGSDLVTGWNDQSGLGNNLTGAGDPRLVANGLNGQATIAFDGTGDKLENVLGLNNLPAGNSDRTVFFLTKYNSRGFGGFAYGNNATNQTFGLVVDNRGDLNIQAWGIGQDNSSEVDGTGAGWLIQGARLENGALTHYLDGTEIDSSNHTYNTSLDRLVIGAEIDSSPYLNMEVAGVLVYDRALNTAELEEVDSYLKEKYFTPITPVNQAPVVANDVASLTRGTSIEIDILNNDRDDGAIDSTTVEVTQPTNGTVVVDANTGVVTYTHDGTETTTDSFTYTVADDEGKVSTAATVSLTIELPAPNQAPVAVNDLATVAAGSSVEINILDNDRDDGIIDPSSVNLTQPAYGTVAVSDTGIVTYTHNDTPDTSDSFTYTVSDAEGLVSNSTTVDLSINHPTAGRAPIVEDDIAALTPGSSVEINVLNNDSDDGIIDPSSVNLTQPANGTVTVSDTGIITYTHDGSETTSDRFTYTVADDEGLVSDPATVALAINTSSGSTLPVSDGLVLHLEADSGVITDGSDLVTGWNDQSGSGNNLTGAGDPRLVSNGLNGQATIAFDGQGDKLENILGLTDLPAGNSDRTVFFLAKYNSRGFGGFAYGNDAVNQAFGLVVDNRGDLMVQAWGYGKDNSSRVDGTGANWLIQAARLKDGALIHYKDGEQIDSGVNTYNTTLDKLVVGAEIDSRPYLDMEVAGILVYDRALNEVELQQVNSYLEEKYFNSAPVPNQAPVVGNDNITVTAGSTIDINVLDNDNDDGVIDPSTVQATSASNGTVTVDPVTGIVTYTHDGSVTTSDRFTYTVADDRGAVSEAATVDITINPPAENQPPVATDDRAVFLTGSSVEINVLSNDNERDSAIDPATIEITQPTSGTATVDPATGIVTYTHDGTETTTDSFSYTVADNLGLVSNEATVNLFINAPSSGNLPVSDGLVLHLEADSGVITNGSGVITDWTDQSGLSNNLTGSGDPSLILNENGQPAIAFDGEGDKLENILGLTGLPAGNGDRTIFFLAKYNSRGFGGFAYGNNATNQTFGLVVDNRGDLTVQAWGFGQDNSSPIDGTGAGWLVQGAKLENGRLTHYLDGTEIDSGNHTYNTTLDRLVVGAEIDSSPYLDMEVGGILVYDRALSTAELRQVNSYLEGKYGLA